MVKMSDESHGGIFGISGRADTEMLNLRKMLTLSDSVGVFKFLESTANFESPLEEQHLESDFVALRTWCVPFQHLIRFSISSALKSWEFLTMSRFSMSGC